MKIRVDGHNFELLGEADLSEEELAQFSATRAELEDGHMSVQLVGDADKAVLYDVNIHTNAPSGRPASRLKYTLLRPPGENDMNLSELRPMQIAGQPVPESQIEYQAKLFYAVGAIAVAGAHVELAMRKVYLSLSGGNRNLASVEVSKMWQVLENKLRQLCDDSTDVRKELKKILDWSNKKNLSTFRNHAVHGYWWLFDIDGMFHQSRYHVATNREPKQPSGISINPDDCRKVASNLFMFANRLEALVSSDWPVAIMPVYEDVKGEEVIELEPIGMADAREYIRKPVPKPKPGRKPKRRRD